MEEINASNEKEKEALKNKNKTLKEDASKQLEETINISKNASIDDLVDQLLVVLMQSTKHESQTRSKILETIRLRIECHADMLDKEKAKKQLPQIQLSHKEIREKAARLLNKRLPANIDNMDWKETTKVPGNQQQLIDQYELRATLLATSHGDPKQAASVISNFLNNKTNTKVQDNRVH